MNRRLVTALVTLVLPAAVAIGGEVPVPDELLRVAVAQHDPQNEWATSSYRMVVRETRPDGSNRDTSLLIDNRSGRFEMASLRDGDMLVGSLGPARCEWTVNGSSRFTDETRDHHRLTCERLERLRNYYVYLWGLPMKLGDPGTHLGEVAAREFEGKPALELRVTYEESVGSDIWYIYFDPERRAMIGYRFYHDEAANDGEYIVLEGTLEDAGLRLPKSRAWYTHKEGRYLGTDTLLSIEKR